MQPIELFQHILDSGLRLRVRVTGRSMRPMVRSGDVALVAPVSNRALFPGDLILFRNRHGQPVLHRILFRRQTVGMPPFYRTKGDACLAFDPPVGDGDILGRVIRIERCHHGGTASILDLDTPFWKRLNFILALAHRGLNRLVTPWYRFRQSRLSTGLKTTGVSPVDSKPIIAP
jgi:signal peptidase I